jgi:hypothetical protein
MDNRSISAKGEHATTSSTRVGGGGRFGKGKEGRGRGRRGLGREVGIAEKKVEADDRRRTQNAERRT